MKNLILNDFGVQEMNAEEMRGVDGGKVAYIKPQWSGTDNELCYAIEAVANACVYVANGGIWIWNHTFG